MCEYKGVHGMAVTEPDDAGGVWVGADPGGKGNFGVALVDGSGKTRCKTVSSVHEAMEWIKEAGTPLDIGIDAPMWWSADVSGGRRADERLKTAYKPKIGQTVQPVNSLRGAAIAGGLLFASRMREAFPRVRITESHPKALLKALWPEADAAAAFAAFAMRFGIDNAWSDEHQRDAVIAAVCAREGFCGRWRVDLSKDRSKLEQNPQSYWLAPVSYFWPESPEQRGESPRPAPPQAHRHKGSVE